MPMVPLIVGGALVAGGAIGSAVSGAMKTGRRPDQRNYSYNYDASKDPFYKGQQRSYDGLMAASDVAMLEAQGKLGPSVAEQQMRAGQAQAAQQGMAMAASARGGAGAQEAAQRQAQDAAQLGALAVNRDAGIVRAQERQAAQGRALQGLSAAGDVATQGRGQTMQGEKWAMDARMGWDAADRENEENARRRKAAFWGGMMSLGGQVGTMGLSQAAKGGGGGGGGG